MERQANAYSALFRHCVQVLNEYPNNVSEENFLDEYFRSNKVRRFVERMFSTVACLSLFEVSNESFVSTILIDCMRHAKILQTITDVFYRTDGANIRRSEQSVYRGEASRERMFLAEREREMFVADSPFQSSPI